MPERRHGNSSTWCTRLSIKAQSLGKISDWQTRYRMLQFHLCRTLPRALREEAIENLYSSFSYLNVQQHKCKVSYM